MSSVDLHTVWGWWRGAEGPSLLVAWDEFDVDDNPEGWAAAQVAAESDADLEAAFGTRRVTIRIDYEDIHALFMPKALSGSVIAGAQ